MKRTAVMGVQLKLLETDTFIWKLTVLVTTRIRYSYKGNVDYVFGMAVYAKENLQAAKKELTESKKKYEARRIPCRNNSR